MLRLTPRRYLTLPKTRRVAKWLGTRPQWSYAREREVCACGRELPCPAAARYAITVLLPTQTIAGHDSNAPLVSAAFLRIFLRTRQLRQPAPRAVP
jgi:hypothetical protein